MRYRTSFAARHFVWLWAVSFLVLLSSVQARAHLADEGGVHALLLGVEAGDSGSPNLIVFIANNTALSITLRGITTRAGDPAKIERKKTVLWTDVRQPVKFLRLSPGENIEMAPPQYFITLPGVSANALLAGRTNLVADFGPEGQVDLVLPGPVGGPREAEALTPIVPQTME